MVRRSLASVLPSDRWSAASWVALAAVALVLLAAFGGLLGAFDFQTLWRAGSRVLHGANPYDPTTSAVFLAGHAFVYPAFVAWLFVPLAALPSGVAEGLYLAGSVAAIAGACTLFGRSGWVPSALILASSATIVGLQMGTVNAWLFLGLAVAWRLRSSHGWLGGIVLGVAVTVKLFLLPMLAWPVIARRYGMAAAGVAAGAVMILVSTVGGPISLGTYRHLLSSLSANEVKESWSLASFLEGVGASAGLATAASVVVAAAVLLAVWARSRHLTEAQVASVALLCCLLVSPIVWSSYLLLLAVPLLLTTRGHGPLVFASAISWGVVVPDVAPALNLVAGIVLLAAISALGAADRLPALLALVRRSTTVQRVAAVAGAGLIAAVIVAVPPAVRNSLPTLLCLAALGVVALRRVPRGGATPTPA